MKNYFLLTTLLFCVLSVDAQENKRNVSPLKPARSTVVAGSELEAIPDTLQGETIEYLEKYIQAIDTKVEYVNSDQTLREKAMAEGWFDRMSVHRARAVARKELLLAKENE